MYVSLHAGRRRFIVGLALVACLFVQPGDGIPQQKKTRTGIRYFRQEQEEKINPAVSAFIQAFSRAYLRFTFGNPGNACGCLFRSAEVQQIGALPPRC